VDVQRSIKYGLDRLAACLLLVILAPVLAAITAAIRLQSPGGPLCLLERVGAGGSLFTVFRFRTGRSASEAPGGGSEDEPASTTQPSVGRWLQDTHLAGLPQLFNVALGEMSFVGPRPAVRKEVERYTPRQRRRLLFRPGITGWAQVSADPAAALDAQIELDLYYVDHHSLAFDLATLWRRLRGEHAAGVASASPVPSVATPIAPAAPATSPPSPAEAVIAPHAPARPDLLPLLVIGAGGHARVVVDVAEKQGRYRVAGLLDDRPGLAGTQFMGYPVLGGRDVLRRDDLPSHAFVAIGAPLARQAWQQYLEEHGYQIATLVHPSAQVGREVALDGGTVLMAGAIVNSGSHIGRGVIVNTAASVDHDCEVGDFAHIAPGARLAGGVHVGARAHVGIGSCVLQNIPVGDDAIVGGGAAVVRAVPAGVTVVGVPAQPLPARRREPVAPQGRHGA
jgi:sugar O-acyltransferase (sialic acid O-acetyltransferase NeuD family)